MKTDWLWSKRFCVLLRRAVSRENVILLLLTSIMLVPVWWLLEPTKNPTRPIDAYAADAVGNRKTVFRPGDVVYITRETEVMRYQRRTINASIVNVNTRIIMVRYEATNAPDVIGMQKRAFAVHLPEFLPSGDYIYRAVVTYDLNPLREVSYELPPVRFRVE